MDAAAFFMRQRGLAAMELHDSVRTPVAGGDPAAPAMWAASEQPNVPASEGSMWQQVDAADTVDAEWSGGETFQAQPESLTAHHVGELLPDEPEQTSVYVQPDDDDVSSAYPVSDFAAEGAAEERPEDESVRRSETSRQASSSAIVWKGFPKPKSKR